MIREVILKTAGMFYENDPKDVDYELWRSIAEYMNEEQALAAKSTGEIGIYVFLGLKDKEKDKELFYMMEQDGMTGIYINDREGFDKSWESGEYEHEGCFILEERYLQSI